MKARQNHYTRSMLILSLLAIASLAGCGQETGGSASVKPRSEAAKHEDGAKGKEAEAGAILLDAEEIEKAGLRTSVLAEQAIHEQINVTATIQPNQDKLVHASPRVPGRLVKIQANLGDRVRPGQTLASLDSIELGEAHSAFLQAESQAALARADFERAEKLHADQIIPQKDYLRSRAEHEKARATLRAATDQLRMMGVAPSHADQAVSTFPLVSPIAGVVIEKHAVLGELAKPEESLFTVADLSVVWIEADLTEKDLGKVRPGAEVAVTLAAYPGEVFKGRLTYISSLMDKETRTVKARVEVPNPEGRFKPEMFASAAIRTGIGGKALSVPEDAVVLLQGQPTVFVREKTGFVPRPVEVGERAQGQAILKSGVQAGETVVTGGAYALKARLLKSQIGDEH